MEKDVMLREGERIESLNIRDRHIIQNGELYTFTSDAVVLANKVRPSSKDNILDIGTGSCVMPLIIASKYNVGHIDAVEVQSVMADMARRSVALNQLEDKISVINEDIKEYKTSMRYDIIMSNPPYFNAGERREREEIAISRHEIKLSLEELIASANRLLKYGGKFYMIHKCARLAETMSLMDRYQITPKVLTLIYPKASLEPDTFVIEGKSHAKHSLRIHSFVMYNEDGTMTHDARLMYNMEDE